MCVCSPPYRSHLGLRIAAASATPASRPSRAQRSHETATSMVPENTCELRDTPVCRSLKAYMIQRKSTKKHAKQVT